MNGPSNCREISETVVPTVILTLVLQRHVVRGLTLGAVKG